MSEIPERFLDRYDLLRQLGAGNMGTVYLAYDSELRRQVALKRMRGGTRMYRERFRREYHALAAIQHRGVPTIYDSARLANSDMYFTMEIVGGETLRKHLKPGRALAPARALALAIDLGRMLMAVHAAGIVHRDVKPDNIVLEGDAVRLVDFGACYMTGDYFRQAHLRGITDPAARWNTSDCEFVGTHGYTDPECFTGETTPRSDVFSVCVLLYEMLTGRRLYDHAAGVFRPICAEEFPPELAPLVPELQRGASLVFFERHASMAALVQRLEIVRCVVVENRPAAATTTSITAPPAARARSHSWLRWGAATASFALLGAIIHDTWTSVSAPAAQDESSPAIRDPLVAAPEVEPAEPPPAEPPPAEPPPAELPPAELPPVEPAPDAEPTPPVASVALVRAAKTRPQRPPELTEATVSQIVSRAAARLRACNDVPRGWVVLAVRVRDGQATLQAVDLDKPSACARKAIATLRFPGGTGEYQTSIRL